MTARARSEAASHLAARISIRGALLRVLVAAALLAEPVVGGAALAAPDTGDARSPRLGAVPSSERHAGDSAPSAPCRRDPDGAARRRIPVQTTTIRTPSGPHQAVDVSGDQLIRFAVEGRVPESARRGRDRPGQTVVSLDAAKDVVSRAVNTTGVVEARAVVAGESGPRLVAATDTRAPTTGTASIDGAPSVSDEPAPTPLPPCHG